MRQDVKGIILPGDIMLKFTSKGNWDKTRKFLERSQRLDIKNILEKYGVAGVTALANATPKDSALTASSWKYAIKVTGNGYSLEWFNTNVNRGSVIAILIQYGHGTGTGGYVPPRDYINPAIKPILDKIADDISKEVSNL